MLKILLDLGAGGEVDSPMLDSRIRTFTLLLFSIAPLTMAAQSARIALYQPTLDAPGLARVQAFLAGGGQKFNPVTMADDWSPYSLVVLVAPEPGPEPAWGKQLPFDQKLAAFYSCGGRVLLVEVPRQGRTWDRLVRYFWGVPLESIGGLLEDSDHRALYSPSVEHLGAQAAFNGRLAALLAGSDRLPAAVDAEDFGPAPRIELRDNSLWVDGKPLLLKSTGFYNLRNQIPMREHAERLRAYHELGLNSLSVVAWYDVPDADIKEFLELARQNQLYIQLQVQGPLDTSEPLPKECVLKYLRYRNHPMLITWELCDDMFDVYYPFVKRHAEIIRRYDRRVPITGIFMDLRRPKEVSDWDKWKKLADFPLTYLYPLQKDVNTLGVKGDIQGGLKDIDRLMDNTRQVWGNSTFAEQFIQAHMQNRSAEKVGMKRLSELPIPTAAQQRLLAYRALLTGVKGSIFYFPESLDDQHLGRSRRNELGLVWQETGLVEDILATGQPPVRLATSDRRVDASAIRHDRDVVVVVVKDQPYYNRYVNQLRVGALTIELDPAVPPGATVYQLDWPRPVPLEVRKENGHRSISLRPFSLTALLLATADGGRMAKIQRRMEQNLPLRARYAVEQSG